MPKFICRIDIKLRGPDSWLHRRSSQLPVCPPVSQIKLLVVQSLITTVDIFRVYRSNFPHGEDSTHWNVMDTAPWELRSGLFLLSALFPGVTVSGSTTRH